MIKEFESLTKKKIVTIEEIEEKAGYSINKNNKGIDVYDVLLAGTIINE